MSVGISMLETGGRSARFVHWVMVFLMLFVVPLAGAYAADCQLLISNPDINYGRLNPTTIREVAGRYPLASRQVSLSVHCLQSSDMTIRYNALPAGDGNYRFAEAGGYQLRLRDALLDGRPVQLGLLPAEGQAPSLVNSSLVWEAGHHVVPVVEGVPVQGQTFSVTVDIDAWLARSDTQGGDARYWQSFGDVLAASVAGSRQLSLAAEFAPAACTVLLSRGGVIDLGRIPGSIRKPDAHVALPSQTLDVAINCAGETRFAIRALDNRSGTASDDASGEAFGLGKAGPEERIGFYRLRLDTSRAMGSARTVFAVTADEASRDSWTPATAATVALSAQKIVGFTHTMGDTRGPGAIQTLAVPLTVEPWLGPSNGMLVDEAAIDGSATIEVIYL